MTDDELREVYSAANPREAHFLRALLNDAGIEARVVGEHLQGGWGDLASSSLTPRIWVREEDAPAAEKVIADFESRRQTVDTSAGEWKCTGCNELNEPTFDICWNCQTPRF